MASKKRAPGSRRKPASAVARKPRKEAPATVVPEEAPAAYTESLPTPLVEDAAPAVRDPELTPEQVERCLESPVMVADDPCDPWAPPALPKKAESPRGPIRRLIDRIAAWLDAPL